MDERRPDPDELLLRLRDGEARAARGKLKIFFGAAPGVGKTYAMLEAAQRARAEGRDVAVGLVETHGRAETAALLAGLEILPRAAVPYRGKDLEELDLDAALRRRPEILLVDELAHTNAPGLRHPKRWQDILELCDAGVEVWTTLNVQHLESLNDVVLQITGVRVRETLPDAVLERAHEIALVDLPPDALVERLREGKVYPPEQAARAEQAFFRRGNLLGLRELALRRAADRVDTDVLAWRREHGIAEAWPVAEHILVCVGPSPLSAALIRAARRMAAGPRATWTAATVEASGQRQLSETDRARVTQHLRLAEALGARVVTLSGLRPSEAILAYARDHNVTRIILGKPTHPRWRDVAFGSLLDEVVRGSGQVDVHVISGDPGEEARPAGAASPRAPAAGYAFSAGVVALVTGLGLAVFAWAEMVEVAMAYLLAIMVVAARLGRGPAVLASILSVAAFDFCFVPPRFTLAVAELRYVLTFAMMLVIGLVISGLTLRIRSQAEAARQRELRAEALYELTRELARAADTPAIAAAAARQVAAGFDARVALLVPGEAGLVEVPAGSSGFALDERERGVAAWAHAREQEAGLGTGTLPGAAALYLPLRASSARALGVLGVRPAEPARLIDPEARQLLDAFAQQTAMALERARLAEEALAAQRRADQEELITSLLSSVSHDLRTPLAAIKGAASALLEEESTVSPALRREMLLTVHDESDRLNRLVSNLLEMTRLEAGRLRVHRDWTSLEEVVGGALDRLGAALGGREIITRLPADLPLVAVDSTLFEQVLINLLENAAKHTPAGTPVEILARARGGELVVEVADRGPGIPPGSEGSVFDKFYRAAAGGAATGTGLGLAVCRGIVAAHGGAITAENRPGGGALFRVTLPLGEAPPDVPPEPPSDAAPAPPPEEGVAP